jgi:hypothetical protein
MADARQQADFNLTPLLLCGLLRIDPGDATLMHFERTYARSETMLW